MRPSEAKRKFSISLLIVLAAGLALGGCVVGPNYKQPAIDIPPTYRGLTNEPAPAAPSASLGDEKWWEVFQDKALQDLLRTAVEENYDVRIAATRILQEQAQLDIARAQAYPTAGFGAVATSQRNAQGGLFPAFELNTLKLSASAAWEPDFWGKFRRGTEAARANLLASEWARQAVISTLVADLADAYFQLRGLDLQLEISQRTVASRRESLELTQTLEQHGINSLLDVRQAEQLVATAAAQITDLERQIEQQENLISILLGKNPGAVSRGLAVTEQPHSATIPAGLPSSLLERRPDIHQAEEQLIALNAQIGVAKAAYYPQIQLTGEAGFQSPALTSLFSGPAGLWDFAGSLTQPLFTRGRLKAGVRFAEAQEQEAVLTYQQTIQHAFRDVSDALVAYSKIQEFRAQQELLTRAAEDAARLSDQRYSAGVTSYLEVLTSQTNYFAAEIGLAQARTNELAALVQLYKALGGGWQQ